MKIFTGSPVTVPEDILDSELYEKDHVIVEHPNLLDLLDVKGKKGVCNRVILMRGGVKKRGTQSTIKKTNLRELVVFSDGMVVSKYKKGSRGRSESSTLETPNNDDSSSTTNDTTDTTATNCSSSLQTEGGQADNSLELKQFEPLSNCRIIDLSNIAYLENPRYLKSKKKDDAVGDDDDDGDGAGAGAAEGSSGGVIKNWVGGGVGALRKGATGAKELLRGFGGEDGDDSSSGKNPQKKQVRQSKFGMRNKLKSLASPQPKPSEDSGTLASSPDEFVVDAKDDDKAFEVLTSERSYVFVASSVEEKYRWVGLMGGAAVKSHEFYYGISPTLKNVGVPDDVSTSRGSAVNNDFLNPLSPSGGSNLFGIHKLSYDVVVRRRLPGWPHLVKMSKNVFTAGVTGDVSLLKSIVHSLTHNQAAMARFNLNDFDEFGYTPLHYAAIHNHVAFAAALLDYGALPNPSLRKTFERTPLFYAVAACNLKMVHLLVANGGNVQGVDSVGMTPLHMIVCNGEGAKDSPQIIKAVNKLGGGVGRGILDTLNSSGDSALHLCAVKGLPRMIQALCNEGANVNIEQPLDKLTPLHLACAKPFSQTPTKAQGDTDPQMFNVEIIRNLVANGAHVNKPLASGFTPIYILVAGEHSQLLVPLVGSDGAEKMILNEQWFFSVFMGVKELIKAGARVSNQLLAQLPSGMPDAIKSFMAEWQRSSLEIEEQVKYARHLFERVVPKSMHTPDSASPVCMSCDDKFTNTNRRHHCRFCGILACSSCTTKKLCVFAPSSDKPERVCDGCYNRAASHLADLQAMAGERAKVMRQFDKANAMGGGGDDKDELFSGRIENDDSDDDYNGYQKDAKGAANAMNEAMDNMNKRGEKLSQIGEKAEDLKNAASEFSQMAKKLRQTTEKRNRWF